jgi:hypothetical protein
MVDRLHRIWRTQMVESSSTEPFLLWADFPGDLVDVWPDNNPFRNSNSPHTTPKRSHNWTKPTANLSIGPSR